MFTKFGEYVVQVGVDIEERVFVLLAKTKTGLLFIIANRRFGGEDGETFSFHLGPNVATLTYRKGPNGKYYSFLQIPSKEECISIPITIDPREADLFMETDYYGKPY